VISEFLTECHNFKSIFCNLLRFPKILIYIFWIKYQMVFEAWINIITEEPKPMVQTVTPCITATRLFWRCHLPILLSMLFEPTPFIHVCYLTVMICITLPSILRFSLIVCAYTSYIRRIHICRRYVSSLLIYDYCVKSNAIMVKLCLRDVKPCSFISLKRWH
jgi:hypothetical protein